MSGSAASRPSRLDKLNVVDDKTRQKLKISEDDPFLHKSLGEQIKIEHKIEKKLGETGPGRFFGDAKEARNKQPNQEKQKEMDRLINTLENDQVKITAAIDTKGKYCAILDSYLEERMRHAEKQQERHEKRIRKLRAYWNDKYEKMCKELKHWKDEAQIKHGEMKRQFQEEAAEVAQEWGGKSENVTEHMVQETVIVEQQKENLQSMAKKGIKISEGFEQCLRVVKEIRTQVNRGGVRQERRRHKQEEEENKNLKDENSEEEEEEEELDDETIANVRIDMDKLLSQLIDDVKKLDRQLKDFFEDDERTRQEMEKGHEKRMEATELKHTTGVQEINKQFWQKWKQREKVLTNQTNDYADKLEVSERIEHMIKANETMKLTAASLSHYFECVTGDPRSEYEMLKKEHADLKKSCHVLRMSLHASIRPVKK